MVTNVCAQVAAEPCQMTSAMRGDDEPRVGPPRKPAMGMSWASCVNTRCDGACGMQWGRHFTPSQRMYDM